jgi:hypothetical protein
MNRQAGFAELSPLSGTWKSEGRKQVLFENWVVVKAGEMQGKSYLLQGSDTVVLEEVRLLQGEDGIFYIPTVKNQNNNKPVSFKLTTTAKSQFTFENLDHDFPQRVIYKLVSRDSLHAWIEGTQNGKAARIDYYYRRLK